MPSPPQGLLHDDGRPSEEWQDWRDRERLQAKDEKKERKALRNMESKMMSQKARAFIQIIQRLLATKQRAANICAWDQRQLIQPQNHVTS